ncbi:C45 family peptidase [Paenibacillus sp. ACRSA]|uniref:C45 family autoproteolytic acyltransferase/hydolase n=1 Tax=Paenibacillus sp. ACRSA TaxID=2918211 RepID=UPI001EF3F80A|nr:C45 family peptidase [Paenibacillus sp. ACRSA]MCG7377948.1 C45 family peptidase [Paenibacillus sp. ACRSA]
MLTLPVHTLELQGTNYEIGYRLGTLISENKEQQLTYTRTLEGFGEKEYQEAVHLFDEWCPGITEEITGFAEALHVPAKQIAYYALSYLLPRCSQIALLPSMTAQNKPLLARNYEFNHQMEDFVLARTSVTGKYTHMGTSTMSFGRDDGFNEHGLVVTMSACGFPVGAVHFMRAPKLKGLHFWAAIRAVLEHCTNVEEALLYLKDMPIACNVNMMLLDQSGNAALFETMDGNQATKHMDPASPEQFLWATNHPVLPELVSYEPQAAIHSLRRAEWIVSQLEGSTGVTHEQLKDMLLSSYPNGLCCHYFEDYFGTTKSMLFSPADGIIELCWGGRAANGWHTYDIRQPISETSTTIQISLERADTTMFGYQSLHR